MNSIFSPATVRKTSASEVFFCFFLFFCFFFFNNNNNNNNNESLFDQKIKTHILCYNIN